MVTIKELTQTYLEWARGYYSSANGQVAAVKLLLEVVPPDMPADDMTCKWLYKFQEHLIDKEYRRRTVNFRTHQIKLLFKWAAHPARELVDETVASKLQMLECLKYGRSRAKESERVTGVPWEDVQATAARASLMFSTMIQIGWWTGMRPGEIVSMRWSAINMEGDVWSYIIAHHKNAWRGLDRVVSIGPKCQEVIKAWGAGRREGEDWLFPGQTPGTHIKAHSFTRHVRRTQEAYNLKLWHPHQLRHAAAERIALAEPDSEHAARAILGHQTAAMTAQYVSIDPDLPRRQELAARYG